MTKIVSVRDAKIVIDRLEKNLKLYEADMIRIYDERIEAAMQTETIGNRVIYTSLAALLFITFTFTAYGFILINGGL